MQISALAATVNSFSTTIYNITNQINAIEANVNELSALTNALQGAVNICEGRMDDIQTRLEIFENSLSSIRTSLSNLLESLNGCSDICSRIEGLEAIVRELREGPGHNIGSDSCSSKQWFWSQLLPRTHYDYSEPLFLDKRMTVSELIMQAFALEYYYNRRYVNVEELGVVAMVIGLLTGHIPTSWTYAMDGLSALAPIGPMIGLLKCPLTEERDGG
jgi:archaellum component FlaC